MREEQAGGGERMRGCRQVEVRGAGGGPSETEQQCHSHVLTASTTVLICIICL